MLTIFSPELTGHEQDIKDLESFTHSTKVYSYYSVSLETWVYIMSDKKKWRKTSIGWNKVH